MHETLNLINELIIMYIQPFLSKTEVDHVSFTTDTVNSKQ